ncbi:MAG TPA: glycosyl hydrolase family 8, partial [Bacteroidales bacterium]|nr:glycosyl hydrolase family 8 [Bacteroidales bacterium]
MKKLILFAISCLISISSFAQAAGAPVVDINSGNPKFPFPQFLPYSYGTNHSLGNLGTNNAPGVVHAEMEKLIREAWQIFANEFTYTGQTFGGVQYIKGNNGCPYDCSEGDGYALLAAAYMGDKKIFDGLWMRTHDLRKVMYPRYSDCVVPRPGYK